MSVYYLCPDSPHPVGGVKIIYRHVDILNAHGIPAYVLHQKRGFRCTWFENRTRVAYTRHPLASPFTRAHNKLRKTLRPDQPLPISVTGGGGARIGTGDLLVIPEIYGPDLAAIGRGIPKVVLNQNGFMTFDGYSFAKDRLITPYTDPSVVGVLVNSEHCEEYVDYAFPNVKTHRFFLSIDPATFHFQEPKRKQIVFSRIKNTPDGLQVINALKFRGALHDFQVTPFINISQAEVAAALRESLLFLSLGNREGFGLPAAEAMACGCIVIGYHGWGGREFFRPEHAFPIEDGDIIGFARTVERVIEEVDRDPGYFLEQRREAARFIAEQYSPAREESVLVAIWEEILGRR